MTTQSARPRIIITELDGGPLDLEAQLPIRAELVRVLPGSDRPDYSLAVLKEPMRFHTTVENLTRSGIDLAAADPQMIRVNDDGTADLIVLNLVMSSHFVGPSIHLSMRSFPVNIACVVDNTQMSDPAVVFSKSYPAAVGFISMDKSPVPRAPDGSSCSSGGGGAQPGPAGACAPSPAAARLVALCSQPHDTLALCGGPVTAPRPAPLRPGTRRDATGGMCAGRY